MEATKTTFERQEKIFLRGLREIIESTPDVKLLDFKTVDASSPNLFFIYTENKDYPDWQNTASQSGNTRYERFISRTDFNNADYSRFPLMNIAQQIYKRFKITDTDNLEMMDLIYPNLHKYRLGTLYGHADIGMRTSLVNEKESYYVGKDSRASNFCIQIVPHIGQTEWLKQKKGIRGYFFIETRDEERIFMTLAEDRRSGYYNTLKEAMIHLGYKCKNTKGIHFNGAFQSENVVVFNRSDDNK